MRILHTADLHLQADDDRTVTALETVLDAAEARDVDLLTIAGDLFDSPAAANELRPRLRPLFSDTSFDILAIPGNHDAGIYEANLDFGKELDVLVDRPIARRSYEGLDVVGLPYTDELTEDLFSQLVREEEQPSVLLLHCTIDIGFGAAEAGAEDRIEYFPVTTSTLGKLGYEYVLAGHIHSGVRQLPLADGGTFVYPGSPLSHSTSETGRRHAVLVDVAAGTTRSVPLDTHYYDRYERTVRPGEEDEVLDAIREWVAAREHDFADLTITVDGFIDRPEDEFRDSLQAASGPAEVRNETRGVSAVLDHPLYQQFAAELDATELADASADAVRTRVLQVMAGLLARREIRP